jgi:hypothetical protein
LQSVAGILPVCCEFTVHKVNGARTLVGGQPNALPEEKQKHIAVPSENGCECFSLSFVWSEPLQFFACAAAAVVEHYGRDRAPTLRAPEQTVERYRPVMHHYGFRPSTTLADSHRRKHERQKQRDH